MEELDVWIWEDLGWSRVHGCEMPGLRWALDTPETREAHPNGWLGKATSNDCFGFRAFGG